MSRRFRTVNVREAVARAEFLGGESGGATDVTASASGEMTTAALQRQMTSAIRSSNTLAKK